MPSAPVSIERGDIVARPALTITLIAHAVERSPAAASRIAANSARRFWLERQRWLERLLDRWRFGRTMTLPLSPSTQQRIALRRRCGGRR